MNGTIGGGDKISVFVKKMGEGGPLIVMKRQKKQILQMKASVPGSDLFMKSLFEKICGGQEQAENAKAVRDRWLAQQART